MLDFSIFPCEIAGGPRSARDSAQPQDAKRKRDSAQPQENRPPLQFRAKPLHVRKTASILYRAR